jgi:hypothetical protein
MKQFSYLGPQNIAAFVQNVVARVIWPLLGCCASLIILIFFFHVSNNKRKRIFSLLMKRLSLRFYGLFSLTFLKNINMFLLMQLQGLLWGRNLNLNSGNVYGNFILECLTSIIQLFVNFIFCVLLILSKECQCMEARSLNFIPSIFPPLIILFVNFTVN